MKHVYKSVWALPLYLFAMRIWNISVTTSTVFSLRTVTNSSLSSSPQVLWESSILVGKEFLVNVIDYTSWWAVSIYLECRYLMMTTLMVGLDRITRRRHEAFVGGFQWGLTDTWQEYLPTTREMDRLISSEINGPRQRERESVWSCQCCISSISRVSIIFGGWHFWKAAISNML